MINFVFAFVIFLREHTRNPEYIEWYSNNGKFASPFTILAATDVEILELLNSQFAGFSAFNAPFSHETLKLIFWDNVLNIFVENVPQFIIQIN